MNEQHWPFPFLRVLDCPVCGIASGRQRIINRQHYTADHLLHCKACHGLRQTVVPNPKGSGFLAPRCLCPCQSAAEKQRKAAEEKRERLERIQRRKAHGLQDRRLCDCTFANDNGKTPGLTAKAKRYVEHWEDVARENIGLLLFGGEKLRVEKANEMKIAARNILLSGNAA